MARGRPRIDKTGMRIGVLKILRRDPDDLRYWQVRCDCGRIKRVRSDHMTRKRCTHPKEGEYRQSKVTSCGKLECRRKARKERYENIRAGEDYD
jgi:hypothetical protein